MDPHFRGSSAEQNTDFAAQVGGFDVRPGVACVSGAKHFTCAQKLLTVSKMCLSEQAQASLLLLLLLLLLLHESLRKSAALSRLGCNSHGFSNGFAKSRTCCVIQEMHFCGSGSKAVA